MNKYYVYAHKRPDGHIFYVGKGRGIRQHQTGNRNLYWKRIVKKHGYESMIVEGNLTEKEAYDKEIIWIKHYKESGQCDANFTDGGDGVRVEKRWWSEAISNALKGKKRASGRESKSFKDNVTKDELTRMYVGEGLSSVDIGKITGLSYATILSRVRGYGLLPRPGGKPSIKILCTTDGNEFASINDAAKKYNLFRENIRKVLHGKYKHTGGKQFQYVTDDRETNGSPS
jgi:hypothetical protein